MIVAREVCETPPDGLGICNGSRVEAGTEQSFNMTGSPANVGPVVYTNYFTVTTNESDLLQFSYTYTNFTSFLEYFNSPSPYFSPESASSDGQLLVNATNNNGVFSGQTTTRAGLYTFVFALPNPKVTDSISFVLTDSAAYETGITVKVGTPQVQQVTISYNRSNGGGSEGLGWLKIPITVYAPTITAVNLTSFSLYQGGWLKIVPSYFPDVGPQGANATLYMVGLTTTTNHNNTNTLFIGGSGADGLTGDAAFSVQQTQNVTVVTGHAPISVASAEYGSPGIVGLLYNPPSGLSSSLTVSVTVAGVLENGSVVPLPSWLNLSYPYQKIVFGNGSTTIVTTTLGNGAVTTGIPEYETDNVTTYPPSSSFSVVLHAYNPCYYVFTIDGTSAPKEDVGIYTVVLDETINGQHFVSDLEVYAGPLLIGNL